MKKQSLILIVLIFISLVNAQEENFNDYSDLVIRTSLDSKIELSNNVNNLEAKILLIPKDYELQDVLGIDYSSSPTATYITNNELIYQWENVQGVIDYGYDSNIKTYNKFYNIKHIDFPLRGIDSSLQPYTEASEFIDINEKIINQANSIAAGESNLFTVVFKIGDWINTNINYNLTTLTADVVQKSSWVLDNKKGVCDEITNLFISMLRSLGIPARFISGTVYSNVNYDWSPHGWAEVYFPGYGWIPYDVTFAQYGWIDPSHVKLMESIDSNEPSVKYEWKSISARLTTHDLNVKSNLISKGSKITSPVSFTLTPIKSSVKQGSFVPVEVKIDNPNNFYIAINLFVIIAPGLTEKSSKHVLLKPNEKKSIFWIVKIPSDIDVKYIYTTKIEIKDLFNEVENTEIKYSDVFDYYSLSEAEEYVKLFSGQEEKIFSSDVSIDCKTSKPYFYIYENAFINCDVRNIGNTILNNIDLCVQNNCENFDLSISENINLNFQVPININTNQLTITLKNSAINIQRNLPIRIYEEPNLKINKIDYPKEISYDEGFILDLLFTSDTLLKNLKVYTNNKQIFAKDKFSGVQNLEIALNSRNFVDKNITIIMEYDDENNNPYKLERELEIKVTNLPFYVKIWLLIKEVFK